MRLNQAYECKYCDFVVMYGHTIFDEELLNLMCHIASHGTYYDFNNFVIHEHFNIVDKS